MNWLDVLPPHLLARAYRADKEFAWARADALAIVAILKQHPFVVLGAEIWLPTNPGPTIPTPFVYTWTLREDTNPVVDAETVGDFIRTFQWDEDDHRHKSFEPYFNLTVVPLNS